VVSVLGSHIELSSMMSGVTCDLCGRIIGAARAGASMLGPICLWYRPPTGKLIEMHGPRIRPHQKPHTRRELQSGDISGAMEQLRRGYTRVQHSSHSNNQAFNAERLLGILVMRLAQHGTHGATVRVALIHTHVSMLRKLQQPG